MSHVVLWRPLAERQLLAILDAAPDPEVIIRAAYRIEAVLGNCAGHAGESRSEQERALFDRPLTVYFEVDDENLQVSVLRVHYVDAEPA